MRKCLRRFLRIMISAMSAAAAAPYSGPWGRVKDFRPLAVLFRFSSGLPQLSRLSTHPAPAGRGNEG